MSKTVGGFPSTTLMMSTPREVRAAVESEAIRLGALGGGGLLALFGIARGGWVGFGSVVAGGLMMRESRRLARRPYAQRWVEARAAVTVLSTPHELHAHWHPRALADTLDAARRGECVKVVMQPSWR